MLTTSFQLFHHCSTMRKLLSICNEYADEYHIMFNSKYLALIHKIDFFSAWIFALQ